MAQERAFFDEGDAQFLGAKIHLNTPTNGAMLCFQLP
jgi:hypothetical protein